MIQSMTGFGRGEHSHEGRTAIVELRSVNSRYFELSSRLPRSLSLRENEIKELLRSKVQRGKITLSVTFQGEDGGDLPIKINATAAKSYYRLLNELRKAIRLQEKVKLEHLLKFSEIFEGNIEDPEDSQEWKIFVKALERALKNLHTMRGKEGEEIAKDLIIRINTIGDRLQKIEAMATERLPRERDRLRERVSALVMDQSVVDMQRLELEVALLADKLDITEECVRFRSHNKFFLEALQHDEGAGRKLNFLIQEMNREANTIGSKAYDSDIAHHVVDIKEDLEKIREQLQNIE